MAEVSTWLAVQGYFSLSHIDCRIKAQGSSAAAGLGSENTYFLLNSAVTF